MPQAVELEMVPGPNPMKLTELTSLPRPPCILQTGDAVAILALVDVALVEQLISE